MPEHHSLVINVQYVDDQPKEWHVVCKDCEHNPRATNAHDFGVYPSKEAADAFAAEHNVPEPQ